MSRQVAVWLLREVRQVASPWVEAAESVAVGSQMMDVAVASGGIGERIHVLKQWKKKRVNNQSGGV